MKDLIAAVGGGREERGDEAEVADYIGPDTGRSIDAKGRFLVPGMIEWAHPPVSAAS